MRTAKRRLHAMVTSARPEELATAAGNRLIAYEEVAGCRRTRRFPKTYKLWLHHGGAVTIRWGMESEELGNGYAAWDQAMKLLTRGEPGGERPATAASAMDLPLPQDSRP